MNKKRLEDMTLYDLAEYIGISKYDLDEFVQKYDRVATLEWAMDMMEKENGEDIS